MLAALCSGRIICKYTMSINDTRLADALLVNELRAYMYMARTSLHAISTSLA